MILRYYSLNHVLQLIEYNSYCPTFWSSLCLNNHCPRLQWGMLVPAPSLKSTDMSGSGWGKNFVPTSVEKFACFTIHFWISCLEIHSLYHVQCTSSFTSGASRSAEEAEHSFQQARHVSTHLNLKSCFEESILNYCKPGLITKPSFQPDGEVRRGADRGEHDAYSHPRCWHHRR